MRKGDSTASPGIAQRHQSRADGQSGLFYETERYMAGVIWWGTGEGGEGEGAPLLRLELELELRLREGRGSRDSDEDRSRGLEAFRAANCGRRASKDYLHGEMGCDDRPRCIISFRKWSSRSLESGSAGGVVRYQQCARWAIR